MRRSAVQSAVFAAAALLVLYLIVVPGSWTPNLRGLDGWRQNQPLAQPPARVLDNPYTSWFLVWQKKVYSHTLVIATIKAESVAWLDDELSDLTDLQRAVYVMDDPEAPLHPPVNKGNEAMAYLCYMIDFYDNLPDVSSFMHSHAAAWHVSEILNRSSSEIVHRLSREKVVREGYVNLRCERDPGCPLSAQPYRTRDADPASRMNEVVANTLLQLFPNEKLPEVLAQPCCAQFSLSREIIRQRPVQYYIALRDWLIRTDYPATVSGRVFEYIWHYLFTSKPVFCPDEHICYCDAFSVCFPTAIAWAQYNDIQKSRHAFEEERGRLPSGDNSSHRHQLGLLIDGLLAEGQTRKEEALLLGSDIINRQKILYSAWEELKSRGEL